MPDASTVDTTDIRLSTQVMYVWRGEREEDGALTRPLPPLLSLQS